MRVGTDEADAVAVVNDKGDVVEEGNGAETFGDVLRDQDRRHVFSLWGRGGGGPLPMLLTSLVGSAEQNPLALLVGI
jgi:hypothetical protein